MKCVKATGLFSLEKVEGGPGSKVHYPCGGQRREGADLLSLVTSGRTQGTVMKLHWGSSGLALGKGSLPRRRSVPGTSLLQHQDSQSSRNI